MNTKINNNLKSLMSEFPFNKNIKNKYQMYQSLLLKENQKYNLIGKGTIENVILKHFYDSALILKFQNFKNDIICDIGSGAGFPGLILKIIKPNLKLTIIESNQKKCVFLKKVVQNLDLQDVQILNKRCEEINFNYYEKFDFVIARAVGSIKLVSELSVQLIKIKGKLILYKGPHFKSEILKARTFLKKLNLIILKYKSIDIKDLGIRTFIFIQKIAKTSLAYPRSYQLIKKEDL